MLGQWEPTDAEAAYGITDGFGAVSALFYGEEQCGMAGHPKANNRKDIYEDILTELDAWETVYDWEANGCEASSRVAFPNYGDYSAIPQFATSEVTVIDWTTSTTDTEIAHGGMSCYVVDEMTDYIVWKKDAFRQCIFDANSYDSL